MRNKIITIWKNKWKIFEGLYNRLFMKDSPEIRKIVKERLAICQSNKCGLYDAKGEGDNVVMKGKPACGGCGCNASIKASCMSCHCFLADIGQEPLWKAIETTGENV